MNTWRWAGAAGLILGMAACGRPSGEAAASQQEAGTAVRAALSHDLPHLNGEHLSVKLVEVSYAPGDSSPPHSHPCPVVAHVVEGSIRSQVRGEPESTYTAGQSFYEAPNGVHQVSANASRTEPAKLLAYFVCDGDAPLTRPAQ
ncbi:MAG TPA: cupin domain-containing protein [Gemmatimonadales bacterium]|jgi:quercetin dioxygenase-like cupin family protein